MASTIAMAVANDTSADVRGGRSALPGPISRLNARTPRRPSTSGLRPALGPAVCSSARTNAGSNRGLSVAISRRSIVRRSNYRVMLNCARAPPSRFSRSRSKSAEGMAMPRTNRAAFDWGE